MWPEDKLMDVPWTNKLISDTGKIICPRCSAEKDLFSYKRLQQYNKENTVPLWKCPECKFVFGLKEQ